METPGQLGLREPPHRRSGLQDAARSSLRPTTPCVRSLGAAAAAARPDTALLTGDSSTTENGRHRSVHAAACHCILAHGQFTVSERKVVRESYPFRPPKGADRLAERQHTPGRSPKLRLGSLKPVPKGTLSESSSGRDVTLPSIRATPSHRMAHPPSRGDSDRQQVALRDPAVLGAWSPSQPRVASAPEPSQRPGLHLSRPGESMLHTTSISARHFDASHSGFGLRESETSAVSLENDRFVEAPDMDPYDCMLLEEQQSSAQRSWCDRVDGLLRDLGNIALTEVSSTTGEAPPLRVSLECQLQHVRPAVRVLTSFLQSWLRVCAATLWCAGADSAASSPAGAAHPGIAQRRPRPSAAQ